MRKCIGFFEEDELTRKAKIQSLTSNNEHILSIPENKTFPVVPIAAMLGEIERVEGVFCETLGFHSEVFQSVHIAFKMLKKRLGLEEL